MERGDELTCPKGTLENVASILALNVISRITNIQFTFHILFLVSDFPQFDLKTYAVSEKSAIEWTHLHAFNFPHTWNSKVESEK